MSTQQYIVESPEDLGVWRPYQTVIIPWAMVYSSGKLSWVTQDRADSAVAILEWDYAEKALVSWDNRTIYYNEVTAIRNYLVNKGVWPEILFQDFAGFDTYDTMYRAKHVFLVERAVVTTQRFHLARAVYIARNLWIDAVWVVADSREYPKSYRFEIREVGARVKAWFEVTFGSKSKFVGPSVPITWESNGWVGIPR